MFMRCFSRELDFLIRRKIVALISIRFDICSVSASCCSLPSRAIDIGRDCSACISDGLFSATCRYSTAFLDCYDFGGMNSVSFACRIHGTAIDRYILPGINAFTVFS